MSTSRKKTAAGIIWLEIPADNLDRARAFCGELFGWKVNPFPGMASPEAQHYQHIDTGGEDASPDGGLMTRMHPQQTITQYISVPSVTESTAKVEKLGGKVCQPRTAVPEMGFFAVGQDTEGNPFALWERNDKAK